MGAIVCYDSLDEKSFVNADTWISEFRLKAKEDAPVVLVATKIDLLTDVGVGEVRPSRG